LEKSDGGARKKELDPYIKLSTAGFRLLPDDGMTATF